MTQKGLTEDIIKRYVSSAESAETISKVYDISKKKVLDILRENSIEIRKQKLTTKQHQEITTAYTNGKSSYAIAKEYKVSKQAILYILNKMNISRRPASFNRKVPIEDTPIIIEQYLSGQSTVEIAKYYDCDCSQISKILRKNKVQTRIQIPPIKKRSYKVNDTYFRSIDHESKAYWLAFIASDGFVSSYNILSVKLQRRDKDHLILLRKRLSSNNIIYDYSTNATFNGVTRQYYSSTLTIKSLELCENIRKHLNLDPKYTKTERLDFPFHLPPNLYRHFIRAMLDGDGNINYSSLNSVKVSFYGTKEMCEGIKKIVRTYCGASDIGVKKCNGEVFVIRWAGRKQVLRILDWLYLDCSDYLVRKYN